jgi:hypothetical protein
MSDLPDEVFSAAFAASVDASYEPEADRASIGMSRHAFRAALAVAYAAGRQCAHEGGKTQFGVRRVGYRSVRVTSEQNGRWLLRQWVVPGELVTRRISEWEVVETGGGSDGR